MLKKIIFSFFLFFFVGTLVAQNNQQKEIKLKTILLELERQYSVKFSYNSTLIKNRRNAPFSKEQTLDEILSFLSKQHNLLFSQIDKRYIVIKEKEVTKNNTICGILVNSKTKEAVAFSSISIKNTLRGTPSDDNGKFTLIKVYSNQQIQIQTIGYGSVTIPVYRFLNNPCLTIELEEENTTLDEVLISDYITQGISKKQNGAIEVAPTKLGILPGLIEPDVLLSLQLLPGIQSPSETASGLQIRGSSPDQNLVLFDGVKMYQSGHFFGLISSFNPYVTKKISLFRNGTSAKFGDRIGGVLDISSGEDVPEFEAGFGVNLTHADAYIKTPILDNKIGLVFSARRSITDWVETITYKNFSESVFQNTRILSGINGDSNRFSSVNNDFYFKDYNLKIVANLTENSKLSISNLFNKNQLNYTSTNDRFREKTEDNITYQNKGTRINWSHTISNRFSQNIDVHTSKYEFDYFGKREQERNNPNDNKNKEFVVQNYVDDVGVNYGASYNLSKKLQLSGGYQHSKTKVYYLYQSIGTEADPNNKFLSDENNTNNTNAFFSEIKYNNTSNTFISLGLRANSFSSVNKWFFEPRLYASQRVLDNFTLKTSGEIKNQAVSQLIEYRNNGIGLENNVWAVTNSTIPVLNSKQLSVGFLLQQNGWNLDVDIYKKKIKGLTLMTDDLANNTTTKRIPFYATGESDINGVDVLLKKRFGNYRSWISYSYTNISQQFKDLNSGTSFDGIDEIPHSLTWSHTYKINQFEFSLGWKLRSGIPYTDAINTYTDVNSNLRIQYGDVNGKRLPNYQKLDFSSTYKFKFSKKKRVEGKIGLSLLNVFNKRNILDRTYELKFINSQGNVEKQEVVEVDKISLGFTPNVVFRLEF